jgi:hypothetical protein
VRAPERFASPNLVAHLQLLISAEVPTIGEADQENPLGVVIGWSRPILMPIFQVTIGKEWTDVRTAVYVICNDERTVRYVGSVDRTKPALAARLRAHLAETSEARQQWTRVGLIRLPDGLTEPAVRRCEGRVGRALDPSDNKRLPSVPGRREWTPVAGAALSR